MKVGEIELQVSQRSYDEVALLEECLSQTRLVGEIGLDGSSPLPIELEPSEASVLTRAEALHGSWQPRRQQTQPAGRESGRGTYRALHKR